MTDHQTIRQMIADDALAATFQTMGQYRTALLAALSRLEAAADHIVDANKKVPELSREDVVRLAREAGIEFQTNEGVTGRVNMSTRGSQKIEKIERFATLVRSVPPTGENHAAHENQLGGMAETPSPDCADQSPTAGMNIAQRILHVGGRNNTAGYVEFGSIQAVEALVRQVLRDLPESPELERLRANIKVYRDAWALMLTSPAVPVGEEAKRQAAITAVYDKLHDGKLGAHWLWCVIEQIAAGVPEAEAMRDFGYYTKGLVGEVKPVGGWDYDLDARAICLDDEVVFEATTVNHNDHGRVLDRIGVSIVNAMNGTTPPAPLEGYKLVPVEPTPEMLAQGLAILAIESCGDIEATDTELRAAFRAMLNAATPQPGDKA